MIERFNGRILAGHPLRLISKPGRDLDALCPAIIQALAPATRARPHRVNPGLAKLV